MLKSRGLRDVEDVMKVHKVEVKRKRVEACDSDAINYREACEELGMALAEMPRHDARKLSTCVFSLSRGSGCVLTCAYWF